MKGIFRGRLLRRLFALGVLQLALAIGTAFTIGFLTRPARPPHFHDFAPGPLPTFDGPPPDLGPPPEFFAHPPPPHHHHFIDPGLYPALLTFLCGVVIIGLGAFLTAGWLRRLLLAEKELLANVSHELRTPLARIRVALDLAAEGDATAVRESLSEIATDLGELERLVEDVLTATRFELAHEGTPGAFALRREELPAASIAEQAAQRFQSAHPARRLKLMLQPAAEVEAQRIHVDPVLFRRVLDNLLENAHKYSPAPDTAVELNVRAEPRRVVFEVVDRGLGIPVADLPHVFEPFFRGERSRDRASGGVGLGLTLAQRIVEAHGGTIALTSQPGLGTVARVTLGTLNG